MAKWSMHISPSHLWKISDQLYEPRWTWRSLETFSWRSSLSNSIFGFFLLFWDGLMDWWIDSFSHWFIYWFRLHVELAFELRTKCKSRTFIKLIYTFRIPGDPHIASHRSQLREASGKTAVLQIHQPLRIAGHLWWGLVLTNPNSGDPKWRVVIQVSNDQKPGGFCCRGFTHPTQWYNNESLGFSTLQTSDLSNLAHNPGHALPQKKHGIDRERDSKLFNCLWFQSSTRYLILLNHAKSIAMGFLVLMVFWRNAV